MTEIGHAGNDEPEPAAPAAADPAPAAAADPPPTPAALQPIRATAYIRNWGSASDPAALKCDDGHTYVVKARHAARPDIARMMVAERVVISLGHLLAAPVPPIALIDVPQDLIAAQPQLQTWTSGEAHGSRFIENTTERAALSHTQESVNRTRFARLAVLFGWAQASDHQFIYEKTDPHRVYSHDHGHFFNGGPGWSDNSLATAPAATIDAVLVQGCTLTADEINDAIGRLRDVTTQEVAEIVDGVPAVWGITDAERVALRENLLRRREELLAAHPPPPPPAAP